MKVAEPVPEVTTAAVEETKSQDDQKPKVQVSLDFTFENQSVSIVKYVGRWAHT